jgi:hypothetical protein
MKIDIKTRYGYVLKSDGSFHYKYVLPIGEHNFPDGSTIIEIADEQALNTLPECNPAPTKPEQLAALNTEYKPQLEDLKSQFLEAYITNNTAAIADIKSQFIALRNEYNTKKDTIK